MAATIFCSALRASRAKSTCSLRLSATATAAASRGVKLSGGRLIEVERVAPGATSPRRKRDPGLPQRAQVALDGSDADLEVLGQLPRRTPPGSRRP
jgi:hypothetical protein